MILDKTDKKIIFWLSLLYAVISFINFGQINHYGSWRADAVNQAFTLKFTPATQVSSVYYYYGLGGGNLQLNYQDIQGKSGSQPFDNDLAIYKWKSITIQDKNKLTQLTFHVITPGIELQQLALFDAHNKLITDFTINDGSSIQYRMTPQPQKTVTNNATAAITTLFASHPPQNYINTYLSSMYFDEVYYARTAYEYLHGLNPYTWVHPPLGMLLIAVGIMLFGMNPFGWRFMPNIAGILLIPVMYMFAKRLFATRKAATLATILIMCDFMHFTVNRMASIDSTATLFITLEYYFLYSYLVYICSVIPDYRLSSRTAHECVIRDPHFEIPVRQELRQACLALCGCGIFFGLAMACKWEGIFTAPLLFGSVALSFFYIWSSIRHHLPSSRMHDTCGGPPSQRTHACGKPESTNDWIPACAGMTLLRLLYLFSISIIALLIIPLAIYSLSYIPYFLIDNNPNFLQWILALQQNMFNFHTASVMNATHPYASKWWSWPLIIKPLSVYYWQGEHGLASSVVWMGNPAIWWGGLLAVIANLISAIRTRSWHMWFLCLMPLSLYLPWVFFGRLSFIYYFYAVTPFWILNIVNVFEQPYFRARPKILYTYVILVIGLFILFYPALSGIVFPRTFVTHILLWFPPWNF